MEYFDWANQHLEIIQWILSAPPSAVYPQQIPFAQNRTKLGTPIKLSTQLKIERISLIRVDKSPRHPVKTRRMSGPVNGGCAAGRSRVARGSVVM